MYKRQDLICAAVISLVDLAYPQILRTMTKTLFTQDKDMILHALPVIAASLFVMYIVQSLCKYYVTLTFPSLHIMVLRIFLSLW